MLWGENRGKWKGRQLPGVEPRTTLAAWAASALPLSHFPLFSPHNIQTHLFPAFRVRKPLSTGSFLMEKIVFGNRFFKYLAHYDHQSWGWILPSALSQHKLQRFVRPQTTQRIRLCRHKTNFSYQTLIPGWFVNCKFIVQFLFCKIPYTRVNKRMRLFSKPKGNMRLITNMRLIAKGKIDHTFKTAMPS